MFCQSTKSRLICHISRQICKDAMHITVYNVVLVILMFFHFYSDFYNIPIHITYSFHQSLVNRRSRLTYLLLIQSCHRHCTIHCSYYRTMCISNAQTDIERLLADTIEFVDEYCDANFTSQSIVYLLRISTRGNCILIDCVSMFIYSFLDMEYSRNVNTRVCWKMIMS